MNNIHQALRTIVEIDHSFMETATLQLREAITDYLNYYRLYTHAVEHRYGFVNICGERIFLQSFKPKHSLALVLVVHGYLDHTGSMSKLINFLTRNDYHVISYDLQGHGLSSGRRAYIRSFDEYIRVLSEIIEQYIQPVDLPKHIIAHSTGAGITIDYLLQKTFTFDKVVLLSPLVRSYAWNLSQFGLWMTRPFLQELKRVFKENSSDKEYLTFVKNDPLQPKHVSMQWLHALSIWNERLVQYHPLHEELLVIQGDRDKTVDWKYNLEMIKKLLPNSEIQMIENGNHQLMNENKQLIENTFARIETYLRK